MSFKQSFKSFLWSFMKKAAKAQQAQGGANAEGKADDNVVDAEYEEVNDDQNKK